MLIYLIKFIHVLFALGLLSLTLCCIVSFDTLKLARFNKTLLIMSPFLVLSGTLLVQPKGYSFHTPWIMAAYLFIITFCAGTILLLLYRNLSHWFRCTLYLILLAILIVITHDAVTKTTFLVLPEFLWLEGIFKKPATSPYFNYDLLKILHILSATLFLTGMVYSCRLWLSAANNMFSHLIFKRIQIQTWVLVVPFGIFQLASGFMLISLKQYNLSELWIVGSIFGFMIVICCWFGFLYLLLSQPSPVYKKLQFAFLTIGGLTLLSMLFLMANKMNGSS